MTRKENTTIPKSEVVGIGMKLKILPSAILCLTVLYTLLCFPFLQYDSIWISDEGNRIIAAEARAADSSGAIADLFGEISDGKNSLSAFPPPYFLKGKNPSEVRSAYSPCFPYLASLLLPVGSIPGARLFLSFLPALLCAVFTGLSVRELGLGARMAALAVCSAGFASPLLFYATLLLEISLFSMISSMILYWSLRYFRTKKISFLLGTGFLCGISLLFREEGWILSAAIFVTFCCCGISLKKTASAFGCFLITAVPLCFWNYRDSGSIFGIHYVIYHSLGNAELSLSERLYSLFYFVWKSYGPPFPAMISACIFAAGFAGGLLFPEKWKRTEILRKILLCAAALAAVGNLYFLFCEKDPVMGTLSVQSLCASFPLAVLPFLWMGGFFRGSAKRIRFAGMVLLISVLLTGLALNFKTAGIFFGPRHFLFLMPFFFLLTFYVFFRFLARRRNASFQSRMMFLIPLCILFTSSIVVQLFSLGVLKNKKDFSQQMLQEIEGLGKETVIATDIFWMPEELAVFHGKRGILYFKSGEDLRLFDRIAQKGQTIVMILSRHFKNIDGKEMTDVLKSYQVMTDKEFTPYPQSVMTIRLFYLIKQK